MFRRTRLWMRKNSQFQYMLRKILSISLALILGIFALLGFENNAVRSQIKTNPTTKSTETLTIAAVGDIMLGSTSINDTFLPPNDGVDMLKEVTPILSKADIAFGNFEGPMLEGGSTTQMFADDQRAVLLFVCRRATENI